MKGYLRRVLGVAVAAVMLLASTAGAASADPTADRQFGPIAVDCGEYGLFTVVAAGNGEFGVAHDVDSTSVAVLLGFRNQTFTYTDPDGNEFSESQADESLKGSGKQTGIWCDYEFSIDGEGLENFSGTGEVKLHITPRK